MVALGLWVEISVFVGYLLMHKNCQWADCPWIL